MYLSFELFRSIVLALGCVFLIVVFMLANITGAVLVLLCVIFTLVDVMGFMYFWGASATARDKKSGAHVRQEPESSTARRTTSHIAPR